MAPKISPLNVLRVIQLGLAFALFKKSFVLAEKITLEQFQAEFRSEPPDLFRHHFGLMFTITGYGDSLYDSTKDVSADCALTARATLRMLEQLKICEEAYLVVISSIVASSSDIQNAKLLEHPLELFCRRVTNSFRQKSYLQASFEVAKQAVKNSSTGGRPPYSDNLINSLEELGQVLVNHSFIPELTKSMAIEAFRNQANKTKAYSNRYHLFAKSVFTVAKKDEFTQPMQNLYDKTLEEILPQITSNMTGKPFVLADGKTFWFFPKMIRMIFDSIAQNPNLLQELKSTAAVIGKDYEKSDLDFSKI
ncbi:hypothetical protein V9T40_000417 [Parthenolecanium corni]|uniref:Uncharacterized protein n=1 Tax=Parthenolecanium corni TaxID=536013 RepID=A0AAN9T9A8_9HEMI